MPCDGIRAVLNIYVRRTKSCLGDTENNIPGLLSKSSRLRSLGPTSIAIARRYTGTLDSKHHPRTTLHANTWNDAEKALDRIRQGGQLDAGGIPAEKPLEEWMKEVQLRGLAVGTTRIYRMMRTA